MPAPDLSAIVQTPFSEPSGRKSYSTSPTALPSLYAAASEPSDSMQNPLEEVPPVFHSIRQVVLLLRLIVTVPL